MTKATAKIGQKMAANHKAWKQAEAANDRRAMAVCEHLFDVYQIEMANARRTPAATLAIMEGERKASEKALEAFYGRRSPRAAAAIAAQDAANRNTR